MKPLSVKQIRAIISGELVHGSDDVIVQYGAYRLKQMKNKIRSFLQVEES